MNKRIVSLFLVMLMVLSLAHLAAAEEATPSWLTDTTPVTLKVYYDRPIDASNIVANWGKEPVSKKWIEETNVNVEWDYGVDESHSKLNMMIASGEYPDIVICKRDYDMIRDLVANDVIIKFNELQDEFAPGFVDRIMGANMVLSVRQAYDTQDIYILPTGSYTPERLADPDTEGCVTGIMVLKNVYEAIGSPDMTTIDGFLGALRKVKEMYPDMIPAQASRNPSLDRDGNPRAIYKLFPMFDLTGNFYLDEATDTYKKYWYSENFYELLEFVNALYNEGLMDPTELTDSGEQLQAKLFNGQVFCNMNNDANNIDWFNTELTNSGSGDQWIFVPQPSINPEGYTFDNLMGGVGDHCIIIFDTPNAGRALQWIDYVMQDQSQMEIQMGVEGVSWDYNEDGLPVINEDIQILSADDKKNIWGINLYHPLGMGGYRDLINKTSCTPEQRAGIEFMSQYYKDYSFLGGSNPENYAADSEEIKIKTNIREYWEPQILQLIMCKPDQLEAKFQETMQKVQSLGQEKLDKVTADFFVNKEAMITQYGSDLDLSFMGF